MSDISPKFDSEAKIYQHNKRFFRTVVNYIRSLVHQGHGDIMNNRSDQYYLYKRLYDALPSATAFDLRFDYYFTFYRKVCSAYQYSYNMERLLKII